MLLSRLRSGVEVTLVLEYDTQNIREEGLDFQAFIAAGGQLYANNRPGLMHHKFVLIDDRLLLTGSFNWTYNSNAENLSVTDEGAIVADFQEEFDRQKLQAKRIFQINRAEVKGFATFPLFENTAFSLRDLRKKVSQGVGVWLVRLDKLCLDRSSIFQQNQLPFDAAQLLAPFWVAYRCWNEGLFEEEIENMEAKMSAGAGRDLRRWTKRMHVGDLFFLTEKKQQVWAVGVVQSLPQQYPKPGFSSCRQVQWLKVQVDSPYLLLEKVSGQALAKYRGSALRLLQEVFGG